jgi:hypothetical protein
MIVIVTGAIRFDRTTEASSLATHKRAYSFLLTGHPLSSFKLSLTLEPHREPTPDISADSESGPLTVLRVADLKQAGRAAYLNAVGL